MTANGPHRDIVSRAIGLAQRAPSLHNAQPWRWVLHGSSMHLYSVPERLTPAADPTGREMFISLGIVLDHFRMAMEGLGWQCIVTVLPDPNHPDHVAVVEFAPSVYVTSGQKERLDAIGERRSYRRPMGAPTQWSTFLGYEASLPGSLDVTCCVLPEAKIPGLLAASRRTELERSYDWRYQAELSWWTGVVGEDTVGVPASALVTRDEFERVTLARPFPMVTRTDPSSGAGDAATILVLSTPGDDLRDHVDCGRALSSFLIDATRRGLATCIVSHVTEVPAGRTMVGELVGGSGYPQILIRVGTPTDELPRARTGRLTVDEVLGVETTDDAPPSAFSDQTETTAP